MSKHTDQLHLQRTGDAGAQSAELIILHGLFGSLDNFQSIAQQFEQHLPVVRMDLPGHGRSVRLQSLTIASMAEAVRSTLKAMNIHRCYFLGHSLGGKVAMQIAGQPDGLDLMRLIIVDIAPKRYPAQHTAIFDALAAVDLTTLNTRRDADRQLRSSISDAGVRAFLLKSLYQKDDSSFDWRFDLDTLQRDYPALCAAPVMTERVSAPTLFIKGGNSDYLQAADEAIIRTAFQTPQFKEIGGTGHWPHAEKPALFSRICLTFLQQ